MLPERQKRDPRLAVTQPGAAVPHEQHRRRIVPERQAHLFMDFPSLGLWKLWQPQKRLRARRMTAAEKRIQAARRDPRQVSLYGAMHTEELSKIAR